MGEVKGDMYGGPLKADTPVDDEWGYSGKDIRQWALDSDPDKIAAAGKAYEDFKNKFVGDDDLLKFIKQCATDLDNAWGGPKSGAPECQQQLSMLWQSAKELIDSADALATALKSHGEDDSDGSLKHLKNYFHKDDSTILGFIPTGSGTSQFQADVIKNSGNALYIDPDHDFKYNGMTDWHPDPGSQEDQAYWQVVNNTARQKLMEHNGLNYIPEKNANSDRPPAAIDNTTTLSSTTQLSKADSDSISKIQGRAGTIGNTYSAMPGYLTLELPPGTVPPQQQNPNVQDPKKPAPTTDPTKDPTKDPTTDPTTDPKNPGAKTPNYNPTNFPYNSPQNPGNVTPIPNTPSTNSPGGTDLSGINNPTTTTPTGTSFPTGDTSTNQPTVNNPTTGYPTPNNPTTGTPTPIPTTPGTSKIPSSSTKFPSLGSGKVPSYGGGLPNSSSGSTPSSGVIGGQNTGRVSAGSVNEAAAANASRALQTEQAEAATAAAARGAGYMPMMPMAGGMGGQSQQDRERSAWLTEDEDIWESDDDVAPPLIG